MEQSALLPKETLKASAFKDEMTYIEYGSSSFVSDSQTLLTDSSFSNSCVASNVPEARQKQQEEKLGVGPLAVVIFYGVSGGAFGVEEAVRSAGSFYTLLGFLVMPFVWSLQEALITAELGTAFPESSGCVAWVHEAFGDCAGWMTGFLGWVSGATDNAIYPVLFVEYLLQYWDGTDTRSIDPIYRVLLFSGTSCLLAYTNWLGLPLVGKMSIGICFIAISPFIVLCFVGAFQIDPSRWFTLPVIPDEDDSRQAGVTAGPFSFATLRNILWRPFIFVFCF